MQNRRAFLATALLSPLAARNWERDAFPAWSEEFAEKVLTASPWAKNLTLPFRFSAPPASSHFSSSFAQIGEPLGLPRNWPRDQPASAPPSIERSPAPPVQTEIYLTARWSSALPVRQALALFQFGKSGISKPAAIELLRPVESEYIFDLAGFPIGMIPQGARRFEAQLLQSAVLSVKGLKSIQAISASVPEHGNHLIATLRFPRHTNLTASDGFIEFSAQAGPMDIRCKFKLSDMIYNGRLEL